MFHKFFVLLGLMAVASVLSAQHTLKGVLLSANDDPVIGAEVRIMELRISAITDAEGRFEFNDLPVQRVTLSLQSSFFRDTRTVDIPYPGEVRWMVRRTVRVDEIIVRSTKVSADAPVSHTDLHKEDLERLNVGQDVPFLLQWTPSMVVTSDAGTGIGYTYLRIRGSDQTRVNVTINGIPLNDAESQQVFWVDLPDLLGSTDGVQIQRGLGSSTNGPGAFGATVNLNTNRIDPTAGGSIQLGGGSFGTWRMRAEGHTGLLAGKYFAAGRISRIHSDGYIDRARADLLSGYLTAGWLGERDMFKVNLLAGQEETYQAWYGVPAQFIDDPELRTYNIAGTAKPGEPHDDEIDRYAQTHLQAFYTRDLGADWMLNLGANYTRGKGYFELYQSDSLEHIHRLWLDNHFYGIAPSVQWGHDESPSSLIIGGGFFQYQGRHFGEDLDTDGSWIGSLYENESLKTDFNVYGKYTVDLGSDLQLWADLQFRRVAYDFVGVNRQGEPAEQEVSLNFFNPKAGLRWRPAQVWDAYLFAGIGHREPNRDDYTESSSLSRPRPERMINIESGWRYKAGTLGLDINGYLMWYTDQLVQTGQLNDVGAATRVNVPDSYRLGLEASVIWRPWKKMLVNAAATISENRIVEAVNYVDDWDTGGQLAIRVNGAPISYSPNAVGHLAVRYMLIGEAGQTNDTELSVEWRSKFVGPQFLDNTGDRAARLDGYHYADLSMEGKWNLPWDHSVGARIIIGNVLDQEVVSNGWIYRFRSAGYDPVPDDPYAVSEGDGRYQLRGLFPQAGINIQAAITYRF